MIISELEKESIILKLRSEFDFFRRLDGRLMVQKQRLTQIRGAMSAEKIQTNNVQNNAHWYSIANLFVFSRFFSAIFTFCLNKR